VLFGRRPSPFDHRPALVHQPLRCLKRLLLLEQRAGQLLDLAALLRRRLGGEPAQCLGNEPLALRLGQDRTLRVQAFHTLVGGTHLPSGLDLLGPQLGELRFANRRRL
jgi:hypothetical protein